MYMRIYKSGCDIFSSKIKYLSAFVYIGICNTNGLNQAVLYDNNTIGNNPAISMKKCSSFDYGTFESIIGVSMTPR